MNQRAVAISKRRSLWRRLRGWIVFLVFLGSLTAGKAWLDRRHADFVFGYRARYQAYFERARRDAEAIADKLYELKRGVAEKPQVTEVIGSRLQPVGRGGSSLFGAGSAETYQARVPGKPLTFFVSFRDGQLGGFNRTIDPYKEIESPVWKIAENIRHFTLLLAGAMWWLIMLGGVCDGRYRRSLGGAALAMALIALAGWIVEPPRNLAIYAFRIPHGLKIGIAMAVASLVLIYWPRRRRNLGVCQRCGYDLRGNVSGICPECGLLTFDAFAKMESRRYEPLADALAHTEAPPEAEPDEETSDPPSPTIGTMLTTIEWTGHAVRLLDQTRLPTETVYVEINDEEQMWDAIKRLVVRGAPAIGVAAAFGVYLGVKDDDHEYLADFDRRMEEVCAYLATSRPTAVNLFWAIDRQKRVSHETRQQGSRPEAMMVQKIKQRLLAEALAMLEEDRQICRRIGEHGLALLLENRGDQAVSVLTHCNAGALATVAYGTALAPIYLGHEQGIPFHVFSDETRPLLQGSRITACELKEAGIPVTVICDNMAATVMSQGKVSAVIVGTDRVAANGDVANKIGTLGVAVLARHYGIPFYVAAPTSSIDLSLASGEQIPIEERDPSEISKGLGKQTAPDGVAFYNPAFDVTPGNLVSAIITENGVARAPYEVSLREMCHRHGADT